MIGFVAKAGNIGRFTDPKQIQKLAGFEIVKKSSGHKRSTEDQQEGKEKVKKNRV